MNRGPGGVVEPAPAAPRGGRLEWRATSALVAVCVIWGATFTLVKGALEDASALLFLTLRFGVALVALAVAFRQAGSIRPSRLPLKGGTLAGLALFGGYLFQTEGLRFTTPARSAFLTGLFIVFVPALLSVTRRKLPQWHELMGIASAAMGLFFLVSPGPSGGFGETSRGDLLTVVCAVSYALHILLLGRYRSLDARAFTLLQIGTAFLASAVSFWWAEDLHFQSSIRLWTAVIVTGVFATAVAFFAQTWAQRVIPPTRTACIFALEPVFAWLTSFLVLGERLAPKAVLGAALILAGIFLVETGRFVAPLRALRLHSRGRDAGL